MAQDIHWKINFQSLKGIDYEVRIYDNYTGSKPASWPVSLTGGGDEPFVTDEDNSDDYFLPVRPSTGHIQIADMNGTIIEDIIPKNNIEKRVTLVSINNSTTPATYTTEWQGFLNCEALSQAYTSVPNNVSLNVNGILAAMDSVQFDIDDAMYFNTILAHITHALKTVETKTVATYNNVYICKRYYEALRDKYIFDSIYFEWNEIVNENKTMIEHYSVSVKEFLSKICKFFGLVARECGNDLYLIDPVQKTNRVYARLSYANLVDYYITQTAGSALAPVDVDATSMEIYMNDERATGNKLTYRGNGHEICTTQGMRRILLHAQLKKFATEMGLPETPYHDLLENPEERQEVHGEIYCNQDDDAYELVDYRRLRFQYIIPYPDWDDGIDKSVYEIRGGNNIFSQNFFTYMLFWNDNTLFSDYYRAVWNHSVPCSGFWYPTAFLCSLKAITKTEQEEDYKLEDGLMVYGMQTHFYYASGNMEHPLTYDYTLNDQRYLYRQRSASIFAANAGKLVIKLHVARFIYMHYRATNDSWLEDVLFATCKIAIKFGDKWLYKHAANDYRIDDEGSFHTIDVEFDKNGDMLIPAYRDGIEVPISQMENGYITLYIFHEMTGYGWWEIVEHGVITGSYKDPVIGMLFDEISVEYKNEAELRTDRSSNDYMEKLGDGYSNDLEYDVELATDMNNIPSPSLIWDDEDTPTTLISLDSVNKRPERDLIQRLASYYGRERRKVTLIAEQPTGALPLEKFIDFDETRKYAPLAVNRNWKKDISTITCFETPDGDE